jgi:L-alanine-DL-glutamate epimerase-like enolase superfamily enzyme
VPAAPIDRVRLTLLAKFLYGPDSLVIGRFQIRDLYARLIGDPFMRVYEMKITMHAIAALEILSIAGP